MLTHDERLADLLVAWDEAEERGERPDLAAICRDAPELAQPLAELLRVLGRVENALEETVPHSPDRRERLPRLVGRYRLTRLIGHGGLGDVYGADDTELPREVAVKLIRGTISSEEARRRFAHEAAITSQLDHPGVVPVFGFHAPDGGSPYYAMRLIRGRSLNEEIAAFHAAESKGRPAEETQRELRRLLASFVAACQTIAYAHSRGVLHRDIKPHNIMVGPYGETLVVDWGLAKQLAQSQPAAIVPSEATETTKLPQHLTPDNDSRTGTVGTLEYMSPEQFHGDANERSDIFSLGATLWKLLAGQSRLPPGTEGDRMRQVARGYYAPPDRSWPDAPPALSAICAKAMAAEPADRYATVGELIEDVEAWLADRPMQAYRDPWYVTARRWVVARLPYVTAVGGLLLAAVVALAIIAGLIRAHNEKIEADAEQLRKNYALAHQATREMVLVAMQNPKLVDPSHNPVRREILQKAIDYYRRALDLQPESLEIRRELALTTLFLGLTEHSLTVNPTLPQSLVEAEQQYRTLIQEHPEDIDLAYGHTLCLHLLAGAAFDLKKFDEATERTLAVYPLLVKFDRNQIPKSGEMDVRRSLGDPEPIEAESIMRLVALLQLGRAKPHEAQIRRWAAETRGRFEARDLAAGGKDTELRSTLGQLSLNAASTAYFEEDLAGAEKYLLAALKYFRDPPRKNPSLYDTIFEVQIQLSLGQLYLRTDRTKEAIAELEPAFATLTPLLDNFEAIVQQNLLPPRMAGELLQRLMDVSMKLVDAEVIDEKQGIGPAIAQAGSAAERKARNAKRLKTIARILPLLVKHFPDVVAGDPMLPDLSLICAGALLDASLPDDAVTVCEVTDDMMTLKLKADPTSFDLRRQQAQVRVLRGLSLLAAKKLPEGIAMLIASRDMIQKLRQEMDVPVLREFLIPCDIFAALDAYDQRQVERALALCRETQEICVQTLDKPETRFGELHAPQGLTRMLTLCVLLASGELPTTPEQKAEARRIGQACLAAVEKHKIPLVDPEGYRHIFRDP